MHSFPLPGRYSLTEEKRHNIKTSTRLIALYNSIIKSTPFGTEKGKKSLNGVITLTTEQKNRIVSLRQAGYGYTAVAREVGITKSAVCKYCHQIGLAGVGNDLINKEGRGNVGSETKACKVTYHFTDEPNEGVVTEVLRILMNVR